MAPSRYPYLDNSFQSAGQVEHALGMFEEWCVENEDLRGVFATAYLQITKAIAEELSRRSFSDIEWSQRYLVRFANLYREALLNYEIGNYKLVPKSWKLAFKLAERNDGFIIQHLLLGINAHINHDLALALVDVNIDPNRALKYKDHAAINTILEKTTDDLKRSVAEKYAPILRRLDRGLGSIDDDITAFSIPKAREHAWAMAVALTAAQSDIEIEILQKSLDEQAAVITRLMLASPLRSPALKEKVTLLKWFDGIFTKMRRLFR